MRPSLRDVQKFEGVRLVAWSAWNKPASVAQATSNGRSGGTSTTNEATGKRSEISRRQGVMRAIALLGLIREKDEVATTCCSRRATRRTAKTAGRRDLSARPGMPAGARCERVGTIG